MSDPRKAWRDTLRDLGVMGLVPEPVPHGDLPPPQPAPAMAAPVPPPRPAPVPAAPKPAPSAFAPPTDPLGAPTAEILAAAPDLAALRACTQGCLACPLGAGRLNYVFGEGAPRAALMFAGEGPGRDEDLQGRPFVGKAGELLDKMIGALGLRRDEVYIANVVKCRPPDNRTPTGPEAQRCLGILRRQIELIQPKVLVTLGATPLRELVGVEAGITKVRGQWQRWNGLPVMPTFHPAYVLRQYTQDVRRAVWEDLKAAKAWADEH